MDDSQRIVSITRDTGLNIFQEAVSKPSVDAMETSRA
jgi:hypothetical protein